MQLSNTQLYIATVLIWGSTFFAIKFQLGSVDEGVSVAYRFAMAAALLFAWCWYKGLNLRFSPQQHLFIAAQGTTLFGINYLLVYLGTHNLTTGLVAVVFSMIVFMNILNNRLFFGQKPDAKVLLGAVFGLVGIGLVFWPELANLQTGKATLTALGFAVAGMVVASFGNALSAHNQRSQLPVMQTNAWGMTYGALLLAAYALWQGESFALPADAAYWTSLVYLAVFGSILAFGAFLTLLGKIGSEKAAYAMILFPIVALSISTVFEGYQWSSTALIGVALVLFGNLLVIAKKLPFISNFMPAKSS
ncbi:MAG TPA: EamA family transporter [Oceanospirillaceae bacterium]|nr:EamA family transporter [Oceanospirillaceae bacterium]